MKLLTIILLMLFIGFYGYASDNTRYVKEIDSNTIVVPASVYNENYSEYANGRAYSEGSYMHSSEEYFIYKNFYRLDFDKQEILIHDPLKNGGKITLVTKDKVIGSKIAWWEMILFFIYFGFSYALFSNIDNNQYIPSMYPIYFIERRDFRPDILFGFAIIFLIISIFGYTSQSKPITTEVIIWVLLINLITMVIAFIFEYSSIIYLILLCIGTTIVWYHYTPLFLVSNVSALLFVHGRYWLYKKYFN